MKDINNNKKDKNFLKSDNKYLCDINLLNHKIKKLKDKLYIKDSDLSIFKKKISELKKKIFNINLRNLADIENINKRNDNNIKNVYKYCLEKFMYDLLPVVDNFKNILKNIKNKKLDINITFEGVKLTFKNFISVIKKFGISVVDKINIPFNPDYHQAMSILKSKDKNKDNFVIEILQEGYILNNRLLRPAMVKVIKYVK